jgi:predicted short-subunit dehydrogenase-like oxidoreductase (DUF2520 family)
MERYNVSFAGAGNVAGALCKALFNSGFCVQQIVSKNESNGLQVSNSCKAQWSPDLIFPDSTEILFVAVPDNNLKEVLNNIKCGKETLVVHTAGTPGLDIFPVWMSRAGVFYPLQTFSKGRDIVFTDLPFLIEASDKQSEEILKTLAESIGGKVYNVDNEHRRMLHLAAVFVNNFTNHMLRTGKEISEIAGFSFEVLEPLIKETFLKALDNGPEKSQTGPAVRNDLNIIEKHLELLSFSPEMQNIYREITCSIINYYQEQNK